MIFLGYMSQLMCKSTSIFCCSYFIINRPKQFVTQNITQEFYRHIYRIVVEKNPLHFHHIIAEVTGLQAGNRQLASRVVNSNTTYNTVLKLTVDVFETICAMSPKTLPYSCNVLHYVLIAFNTSIGHRSVL